MTTFLLIRHAMCDTVGRTIAGRSPDVHLNREGKTQAEDLAARLSSLSLAAIYSSPLERALETAAPIAAKHRLPVSTAPGLNELDFGDWTGRALADLEGNQDWIAFNSFRSGTRIPGGETMTEVLARALREIDHARRAHPDAGHLVAIVSHGDVLRALLAHYLGISLDLFQRLELDPASVSIVVLDCYGPRVTRVNDSGHWPATLSRRSKSQVR
jgi:probable phosphomutase (TIGR03848 family)